MSALSINKGRPRKDNVERYPSGKIKPPGATKEAVQRRTELLSALVVKYPEKFARPLALDPDASWYIGRLFLLEQLTEHQKDAADAYRKAAANYEALLGAPKHPAALDMNRIIGLPVTDEVTQTKRFKRAKRRYERLHNALLDAGRDVASCVAKALREEEVDMDKLRYGLNILHDA